MKYYQMDYIEGNDGQRVPNRVLLWAELEQDEDGWFLRYATDNSYPPSTRRITRSPYITDDGFAVELIERKHTAMVSFTEYHGKKEPWSKDDTVDESCFTKPN